ncbi:hypothetical protein GCM10028772_29020 [Nocardioides ultimimeridianus]
MPSTSVITVSGVASTRSIRSAFKRNAVPESRVSVIIGAPPCALSFVVAVLGRNALPIGNGEGVLSLTRVSA